MKTRRLVRSEDRVRDESRRRVVRAEETRQLVRSEERVREDDNIIRVEAKRNVMDRRSLISSGMERISINVRPLSQFILYTCEKLVPKILKTNLKNKFLNEFIGEIVPHELVQE